MKKETKRIIRGLGTVLFILYVLALIYFLFFSEEYGRVAMEETVPKVRGAANVEIVGLMVSLDRMEVGKGGVKCALDEVHDLYGFETNAIVTMKEVIEHLYNKEYNGKVVIDDSLKAAIDAYYEQYGAK